MKVIEISGLVAAPSDLLPGEEAQKTISLEQVRAEVEAAGNEPILAIVDTPGGNVDEGVAIYEYLLERGVDTHVADEASSIGSVIALAGKKRTGTPKAFGMIHPAWLDPTYLEGLQLNAELLAQLTAEAQENDARILKIYTDRLGKDKEQELLAVMNQETIVGADKLKELGFIQQIVDTPSKVNQRAKKAYAYSAAFMNLIKTNMDNKQQVAEYEGKLKKLQSAMGAFMARFFSGKMKALNVKATDANGGPVEMFIATEDSVIVGKVAYLVEGGQPTDKLVPAGVYTNAETAAEITIDDTGMITEEKQAPASADDGLQAKLDAALAENAALKASMAQAAAKAEADNATAGEELKKKEEAMQAQFNALNKQVEEQQKAFEAFKKASSVDDPDDTDLPHMARLFQAKNRLSKDKKLSPAEEAYAKIQNKYKTNEA